MPNDLRHIGNGDSAPSEALGVIELGTIIRGYRVLDAMVKRSPITVRAAYPVSTGKFLIFVEGGVAEVDEAMQAGRPAAGNQLLADLFLPYCHPQLWDGLFQKFKRTPIDALGLFECHTVVDAILGADVALKAAEVNLAALHLAAGIGGRAYFVVSGELFDAEAAIEAALDRIDEPRIIEHDVLFAPHDDMTLELLGLQTVHEKY